MRLFRTLWILPIALSAGASAQTVSVIEPATQHESGLIRIRGANFGAPGVVEIGGRPAPIANWSSTLIECFVPRHMRPGFVDVKLVTGSAARMRPIRYPIARRPSLTGRQLWRVKIPDQYVITRPALGPDGSVYAIGNFGRLYSIDANGHLNWVVTPPGGAFGCVDILPGGDIVCGSGYGVSRISPQGQVRWSAALPSQLLAGPNVGPDGNIYVVDNTRWSTAVNGVTIFSPSGSILWNGGQYYRDGLGIPSMEIRFGGGNAYFWSDGGGAGQPASPGLTAIALGGGLAWRHSDAVGIQPSATADGGVALSGTTYVKGLTATGTVAWSYNLNLIGAQPKQEVIAAGNGETYLLTTNTKLNSWTASGALRFSNTLGGIVSQLVARPDSLGVALQRQSNFGQPNEVVAFDRNGVQQWAEALPIDNGTAIGVYNRMVYGPSGANLYFGTVGPYTAQFEAHCYIYALRAN